MPEESASSARLRRIGRTLRKLREAKEITLKTAGRRVERSSGSLSLIENGLQPLRLRDLKHILDVYDVPDNALRAGLMELAVQSHKKGWWMAFRDVLSPSDLDHASLEQDATHLDAFEMGFVPGLLQTEEYARAVMRSDLEVRPERADRFVAFRMARQQILDGSTPPRLRVILDEAALRRARGGPKTMRAQLIRLLDESHRQNVTVQVLPFSCTEDPGITETFWMLDMGRPAIFSAVLITSLTGRWILEGEEDIVRYRQAFERVRAVALSETDSRILINRVISEL